MAEEIKKRGRGRPQKGEEAPKSAKKPKGTHGGKREGAGRKKGYSVAYPNETLSGQVVIRIRAITQERIKQLRELTKDDTMPFNRMFEAWVEQYAKDYGLE